MRAVGSGRVGRAEPRQLMIWYPPQSSSLIWTLQYLRMQGGIARRYGCQSECASDVRLPHQELTDIPYVADSSSKWARARSTCCAIGQYGDSSEMAMSSWCRTGALTM